MQCFLDVLASRPGLMNATCTCDLSAREVRREEKRREEKRREEKRREEKGVDWEGIFFPSCVRKSLIH
jgi:hypothetical protein